MHSKTVLKTGIALAVAQCLLPASAATINVDLDCSLSQAITAANTDGVVGMCAAGSGGDTIVLAANSMIALDAIDPLGDGITGLHSISSSKSIAGPLSMRL